MVTTTPPAAAGRSVSAVKSPGAVPGRAPMPSGPPAKGTAAAPGVRVGRGDRRASVRTSKISSSRTGRSSPQSATQPDVRGAPDDLAEATRRTVHHWPSRAARTTTGGRRPRPSAAGGRRRGRRGSRPACPTATGAPGRHVPWATRASISSEDPGRGRGAREARRRARSTAGSRCGWRGSSFGSPHSRPGALPPGRSRVRPPSGWSSSHGRGLSRRAGTARKGPRWIAPDEGRDRGLADEREDDQRRRDQRPGRLPAPQPGHGQGQPVGDPEGERQPEHRLELVGVAERGQHAVEQVRLGPRPGRRRHPGRGRR